MSDRMRWPALFAAACALFALLALCACAPAPEGAGGASAGDAAEEGVESTAMVIYADDKTALLADRDTGAVYFPTIPEGALFDAAGQSLALGDLRAGNVVAVVGNGIMLESYPGQYPGITRVQVLEEGDPADADEYADLVAEVIVEHDENEVPSGTLDYATDLAKVAVMLEPGSYTWVVRDGAAESTMAADAAFSEADGRLSSELADARIAEAVDAELRFPMAPASVSIKRTPVSTAVDGAMSIQLAAEYEAVPSTLASDGAARLRIEPGYLYVAEVRFSRGEVLYPFVTAK